MNWISYIDVYLSKYIPSPTAQGSLYELTRSILVLSTSVTMTISYRSIYTNTYLILVR